MAKLKPFTPFKGGHNIKDKGWEKKIFKPYEPAFPQKVYDPKKGNTNIIKP